MAQIDHKKVVELTNKVIDALNEHDLEVSMTVLSNILGHIIAETSEGRPSFIQSQVDCFAENVKRAAIEKILHAANIKKVN